MNTNTLIHHQTNKGTGGMPRIVIVGGGFGGLEITKSLRKMKAEVVLFDKCNHHTFQPLLYQVATSAIESSSIIYPFRKRFKKQTNFYFRLGEVNYITPEEHIIETSIGRMEYDYLVIATGASTNYYGNKEIEKYSIPMKSIQDAIRLRNKIIKSFENALLTEHDENRNSYMDFVIVGGGPTGVEIAGALAELKHHIFPRDYKELDLYEMDVDLIEAAPRLLGGLSEQSAQKAKKALEKMGVRVHLGAMVKSYDGYTVKLADGRELISRNLIWAAGVQGSPIPGLKEGCVVRGNRLQVDQYNRVKGHENIFAIGDVAAMITEDTPRGHPMVAPPAIQQGKLLARNLQNLLKNKPLKPFVYKDKGAMATVGRNKAVVDLGKLRFHGFFAWFVWMFVHLLTIVGFRNRVFLFFNWFWSYITYDKSNRLIIGTLGAEEQEDIHSYHPVARAVPPSQNKVFLKENTMYSPSQRWLITLVFTLLVLLVPFTIWWNMPPKSTLTKASAKKSSEKKKKEPVPPVRIENKRKKQEEVAIKEENPPAILSDTDSTRVNLPTTAGDNISTQPSGNTFLPSIDSAFVQAGSSQYYAVLGSFRYASLAHSFYHNLVKKGATQVRIIPPKQAGLWFQVVLGGFSSEQMAQAKGEALAQKIPVSFWILLY